MSMYGLIPSHLFHLLYAVPPLVLWRFMLPAAQKRGIVRYHNASLAVSFWEEALFRGVIYGVILALLHSTLIAIIGSSLLFGLFHLRNLWWASPKQVVINCLYTGLFAGPLFAIVRWLTGDIYLSILVHYLHNVISARRGHPPTDDYLDTQRTRQNAFQRFFSGIR